MDGSGMTLDALIDLARTHGFEVTPDQLARWRKGGLIGGPAVIPLGRGRGTVSVYPPVTGELLLAICRIHTAGGEKRLDRVAWRLWWEGYGVPIATVRAFLGRAAAAWAAMRLELRNEQAGGLSETALRMVDAAPSARLRGPVARARRRVGAMDFDIFAGFLYRVAAGTFEGLGQPGDPQAPIDLRAIESGFDLGRGRTEHIGEVGPWLPATWIDDTFAAPDGGGVALLGADELAEIGDGQLAIARDEVRAAAEFVGYAAGLLDRAFGRGAFGLSVLGETMRELDPQGQALWFLMWARARFRGTPAEGERLAEFVADIPRLREELVSLEVPVRMREEVPALASALSPERLLGALRDPERFGEELRREYAAEAEAFVAAHPEYFADEGDGDATASRPDESTRRGGKVYEGPE